MKLKQKAMYELRAHIREGISVYSEVIIEGTKVHSEKVKDTFGKLPASLTSEVLKAKDPHDGQNLLAYAASYGRKEWFLYAAKRLAREVRSCYLGMVLNSI